jgi:hypothetical protein
MIFGICKEKRSSRKMDEELGECTYCMKTGRKKNLTPMIEINKPGLKRQYCPKCLPIVEKSIPDHMRKLYYFGLKGSVK